MSTVSRDVCSVMFPASPVDPRELDTFAKFVTMGGLRRLYLGQTNVFEPHTTLARLVGQGTRTPVGTAVTLMPMRHPVNAAYQARELAVFSGTSYVAGLGMGSRQFNEAMTGRWPRSPLTYVREYATIVRALVNNHPIRLDGEYFDVKARLNPELDAQVQLGLGVLRPKMTELAGELADVGISWLTPPEYCGEHLVPALQRGARRREEGAPRLATVVGFGVERPGRDPVEMVKGIYGGHLAAPHYGAMLELAGYDVIPGDVDHNAREVVDRGLYAYGSPAEVVAKLRQYRAAGCDELILNPGGTYLAHGGVAALQDLQDVLTEISSTEPESNERGAQT